MQIRFGAELLSGNRCRFTAWAPLKKKMLVHIVEPRDEYIEMTPGEHGYFSIEVENIPAGTKYFFKPDNEPDLPDPLSLFQPEGVHGPSEIIDHNYSWNDTNWRNIPFNDLIFYELHVGTFTGNGTFEAIIPMLDDLKSLGVNAIELMPVAQFPGTRNWGYDAVYPYAVQNSYGGPLGLKKLVDACHQKGIAVFLDVVYNHLGPEGNYFEKYGPYLTEKYSTPWGNALNFDGEWSDGVREYFFNNALYWFQYFHVDGLRLDAIHMVFDNSAVHFWELMHNKIQELEQETGRCFYIVAESDLNSPRVLKPPSRGGFGFDAQWLDDFHHALYVLLDPEGQKRYEDFGSVQQLAKAYKEGFVLSGDWVNFRKRKYGTSSAGIAGNKFIVFNQNHDQVGNRIKGERLCMLVDEEKVKIAAAAIILSPYIPMLFMGEEYADASPFFYFVDHSEKELIEAVRKGRKNEFKDFGFETDPPDPQDKKTFEQSKIKWNKRKTGKHKKILHWHERLIEIRKNIPVFKNFNKEDVKVNTAGDKGLMLHYSDANKKTELVSLYNFSDGGISFLLPASGTFKKILYSKDEEWLNGEHPLFISLPDYVVGQEVSLPPYSVAVYFATK